MMANAKKNDPKSVSVRRNRETADAAPYLLRQMIGYKATLYGSEHGLGGAKDGRNSTDVCSECWHTVTSELSSHWHHCPYCGLAMPRKQNAARVILARATGRDRDGPVPGGAKLGSGPVCPGSTGDSRKADTPGRRPKGLSRGLSATAHAADLSLDNLKNPVPDSLTRFTALMSGFPG